MSQFESSKPPAPKAGDKGPDDKGKGTGHRPAMKPDGGMGFGKKK